MGFLQFLCVKCYNSRMERDYNVELTRTMLGQIRENDHNKMLELVMHAVGEDKLHYRTLTVEERDIFVVSGNEDAEPVIGGRIWAGEHYLLGNLAFVAKMGYLSFSLLSNGDALVMQVQGRKGKPFTPEKRTRLINAARSFASEVGVRHLLLVNGSIVNEVKGVVNPRIDKVYTSIAKENGFMQELNGIPYIDLRQQAK